MRKHTLWGGVASAAAVGTLGGIALLGAHAASPPQAAAAPTLRHFSNCGQLRAYASRQAERLVTANGYGAYAVRWVGVRDGVMFRGVPGDVAPAPTASPTGATGGAPEKAPTADATSGTNVQEKGVDEPDIVWSDAQYIITSANGAVSIFTPGDTPTQVGRVKIDGLPGDAQLLRVGDRVVVMGQDYGASMVDVAPRARARSIAPMPYTPRVVVHLIDIANPAQPRVIETMRIDGELVGARRPQGGALRLVVRSTPDPVPMYAVGSAAAPTQSAANARNRAILRRTPARTWLPSMEIRRGGTRTKSTAVGCADVSRASEFAGLGTVSVLTIDPSRGVTPVDRDAVMTDGQIIYGSPTGLYITTPRWVDPAMYGTGRALPEGRTQIHRLDMSQPMSTEYRSSGVVPGYVMNQFSLSEYNGVLRVASTREPEWMGADVSRPSESFVTTLAERDGVLAQVGQIRGLGRSERIYGVRFIGPTGYVVTFRQMDPLYVIDLTDPAAPVRRGELKIPGYSAYLHPVGDGLLLGVGQDATEEGRAKGTQISLFDVSNPANPTRLHNLVLPDGWSEAENDHHAFLYWAPTGLTMVPVTSYGVSGTQSMAVAVRVSREGGIQRITNVVHPVSDGTVPTIRRSMVIGERVFTLSNAGVAASRLGDLSPLGYTPLGG